MSLRGRLLLALAYILLLAIVALEVPLAISLRDRVDAEVRSQARSQAEIVAATVAGNLGAAERLDRTVRTAAETVRGRVVVTDLQGALLADSAGTDRLGTDYGDRPEIAQALQRGKPVQDRRRSNVPILMLTARGTETDRIVGLEIGADDYVVKPFSGAEVIARIRAVLRRSAARAPEAAAPAQAVTVGELEVDPASRRARLAGVELQLSRKEFDLLAELIGHAGRVVTREDLMARVWDENWFGSTKTLDVHIRWLRQKLGESPDAPRYLHTVRGVGFRFTAPEEWE